MPAPTNTSFGTAIDIGSTFPYSNSQQIDDGGIYYTVYYKITGSGSKYLSFFFFGSLTDYIAEYTVYESDQTTVYLGFNSLDNLPFTIPVPNGNTYYIKIVPTGTLASSPATLTVSVEAAPTTTAVAGNILIPDDTEEFPLAIVDEITGLPIKYVLDFATGEYGCTTSSGYTGMANQVNDKFYIYDNAFGLVISVDAWPGQGAAQVGQGWVGSNHTDKFYFATWDDGSGDTAVKQIDTAGAVLATFGPLFGGGGDSTGYFGMDASHDDTILYYTGRGGTNGPVRRFDLVNNLPLSDLVAAVATYSTIEIKTLSDGTILVMYSKNNDILVKQYSAAGAVLNTYTFIGVNTSAAAARLDTGADDPISFWGFFKDDVHTNYQQVKISDGSILTNLSPVSYEGGLYAGTATASPLNRFGASGSCPIMIFLSNIVTGGGGLYLQTTELPLSADQTGASTPSRTNDELFTGVNTTVETAIPDPTVVIYPAGD
jgi:hypothetical protein